MPDDRAHAPAAKVAGIAHHHPCVGLAVAVVSDGEATFSGHAWPTSPAERRCAAARRCDANRFYRDFRPVTDEQVVPDRATATGADPPGADDDVRQS